MCARILSCFPFHVLALLVVHTTVFLHCRIEHGREETAILHSDTLAHSCPLLDRLLSTFPLQSLVYTTHMLVYFLYCFLVHVQSDNCATNIFNTTKWHVASAFTDERSARPFVLYHIS